MKPRSKVRVIVGCILILGLFVLLLCPQLVATRYDYFDINNGNRKSEWKSFGRVYKERVEETPYSRLLQRIGMPRRNARWTVICQTQVGIQSILHKEYIDYIYGRIASDADDLATVLNLDGTNMVVAPEKIRAFQNLVEKGEDDAIKQYVINVQTTTNLTPLRRD